MIYSIISSWRQLKEIHFDGQAVLSNEILLNPLPSLKSISRDDYHGSLADGAEGKPRDRLLLLLVKSSVETLQSLVFNYTELNDALTETFLSSTFNCLTKITLWDFDIPLSCHLDKVLLQFPSLRHLSCSRRHLKSAISLTELPKLRYLTLLDCDDKFVNDLGIILARLHLVTLTLGGLLDRSVKDYSKYTIFELARKAKVKFEWSGGWIEN
jgi:hypothetical protein